MKGSLCESEFVYHIGPVNGANCGWLSFDVFLTSVSCSVCGQTAGNRVVGIDLNYEIRKCLSPLFGDPVPLSAFMDASKRCSAIKELQRYLPMPGDCFGPATWVEAPSTINEISFPNHAAVVVANDLLKAFLYSHLSDSVGLVSISGMTRKVVAPIYGPWNCRIPPPELEPECLECRRNLGTFNGKAKQYKLAHWKAKTIPRRSLPDTYLMASLFGSGILVSQWVYAAMSHHFTNDVEWSEITVV